MKNKSSKDQLLFGFLITWALFSMFFLGGFAGKLELLQDQASLHSACESTAEVRKAIEAQTLAQYIFNTCFPYLLSAITIYMNVLAGNKRSHAWAVGLVGQVGWTLWIVVSANWGFLPMNIALWIIYLKNHLQWVREAG